MEPAEEQEQELEALQSIYPTECVVLNSKYPSISFFVRLTAGGNGDIENQDGNEDLDSEGEEDDEENEPSGDCVDGSLRCKMRISWPADYPTSSKPTFEICGLDDVFDESRLTQLVARLNETAEENLGMASSFTVINEMQEQLLTLVDELEQHKETEATRLQREQEERDRKKMEGTAVNVENFMAWKKKFDAERKALTEKQSKFADKGYRATGREQFLADASLSLSDVALVGGDGVPEESLDIDESLFDDVDNLELSDDDQ